ncbi:MAG: nicotinate-nucleotide diphosphorylase (carboxylating) [Candidatus Methanogaster sp.]|uniref:Nicotinate-nucleotide diphosphorylase (Carboxylating) n=1 Tax=Candidatus Methanogaster sp. TaxID=3386292 RepID=A0AC61KYY3_9EURY|nr:MAG: nicotinate-nucleotide diphosphorylase (carboxylating) [ANME-2 cluster archaeon]
MSISEIELFLREDIGDFDLFHELLPDDVAKANIVAKEDGIVAGLEEAIRILSHCGISATRRRDDGDTIAEGDVVLELGGSTRAILQSERVTLNFLGRMSGIATLTRRCVEIVAGTDVGIAGTRKTTPGFRRFEKKAVAIGGGDPHRFCLSDAVMIKDNHIKIYGMETAYGYARAAGFTKTVEVEVGNAEDAVRAAKLGADIIMFDNMDPRKITEAISALARQELCDHVMLEASGGITLDNLALYAETGVDVISIGALTHSASWLDFSLKVD